MLRTYYVNIARENNGISVLCSTKIDMDTGRTPTTSDNPK